MKIPVEILQCKKHGVFAIAAIGATGDPVRVSVGKCCGSWSLVGEARIELDDLMQCNSAWEKFKGHKT